MNTTTNRTEDVERYVEAVSAHLRDLPPGDAAELLEDLQQHLAEVASEGDTPLVERLGPPERYAEELRASAGLPTPQGRTPGAVKALGRVAAVMGRLAAHPRIRALRAPGMAWWIGRGYACGLTLGIVTTWRLGLSAFPVPVVVGDAAVGLVVTAGLIVVSVSVGRHARSGARTWDRVMTVALAAICLAALLDLRTMSVSTAYFSPEDSGHHIPDGTLARPDGSVISNLHPYGADGQPLENVLLYDQDGRPVELVVTSPLDGGALVTSYPLDRDGRPVMNAYPQRQAYRSEGGDPYPDRPGPDTPSPDVPVLAEEPSAGASAQAEPTPEPSSGKAPSASPSPADQPAAGPAEPGPAG